MSTFSRCAAVGLTAVLLACGRTDERATRASGSSGTAAPGSRPSILLVTLDTTRADAIGPEAAGVRDAGVQRARRARPALPPGVRDGAGDAAVAHLDDDRPLSRPVTASTRTRACLPATSPSSAEQLQQAGYRTAAFVSSFVLARRFGLARGFDVYDDELPRRAVGADRARDDRRGACGAGGARPTAAVRVGALLRSARAVHAAGAVSTRYAERAVPRRSGGDGRADRAPGRRRSSSSAAGHAVVIARRRSRRRARRSRRGAARQSALSVDDARAAGDRRARASRRA